MKKILLFVLMLSAPVWAQKDISVGAFGGFNLPILQSDAGAGSDFGIKAKFSPIPKFAGAAFFEARTFGNATKEVVGVEQTIDGGDVTSFGVEALIGNTGGGPGSHFYFFAGISSYKWTRDYWEDVTELGFHFGPGFEVVLPASIGLEFRAKLEIVPTDGGGSRKNGIILFGANYHIGLM